MTYCPSQDWDAEVERQDQAALGDAVSKLHDLAANILPAVLANPVQFTENMAPADMAQFAYEIAATMLATSGKVEQGGTRYITARQERRPEEWEDRFWARWGEDLLP